MIGSSPWWDLAVHDGLEALTVERVVRVVVGRCSTRESCVVRKE